jgi:hypothetical protein
MLMTASQRLGVILMLANSENALVLFFDPVLARRDLLLSDPVGTRHGTLLRLVTEGYLFTSPLIVRKKIF